MSNQKDVEQYLKKIFEEKGAIHQNDHFVLASGRHTDILIDVASVFTDLECLSHFGSLMALRALEVPFEIHTVLGPMTYGAFFAPWVAEHISRLTSRKVVPVFANKTDTGFEIPKALLPHIEGKNIFVVDDVVTTGGTFKNIQWCTELGRIIGYSCLWNRGGITRMDLGVLRAPFFSLIEERLPDWDEEECPLCKDRVPVNTEFGHGADFLREKEEEEERAIDWSSLDELFH